MCSIIFLINEVRLFNQFSLGVGFCCIFLLFMFVSIVTGTSVVSRSPNYGRKDEKLDN